MDYRLLEFLGNYYLYAAKYQKQVEDFQNWMSMGGSGFKDIADLFKNAYGLDGNLSRDEFSTVFKQFQKNYTDLFSVTPMVPEEKYLEMKQKCEDLEKEIERQKKTIETLSSLTGLKDSFQENMNMGMDQVIKNQKEIFETIMNSFSKGQKGSEDKK